MGVAVAITRTDRTARELRREAAKAKDAKAARRLLAIALVMEGSDRASAARACGMDRRSLRDWVHRYNAEGIDGLCNRKPPGPACRLTRAQEETFARWVEAGPDPDKDGVVRWRRKDLQRKLAEAFGVTVHERTVGKFLARLGYVRLSTRPRHPKADKAAQAAFKKLRRSCEQSLAGGGARQVA